MEYVLKADCVWVKTVSMSMRTANIWSLVPNPALLRILLISQKSPVEDQIGVGLVLEDQIGVTTVSPALDNEQCWVAGEWRNVWVGRKDLIMQISWGIRSSPSWYEGCVLVWFRARNNFSPESLWRVRQTRGEEDQGYVGSKRTANIGPASTTPWFGILRAGFLGHRESRQ